MAKKRPKKKPTPPKEEAKTLSANDLKRMQIENARQLEFYEAELDAIAEAYQERVKDVVNQFHVLGVIIEEILVKQFLKVHKQHLKEVVAPIPMGELAIMNKGVELIESERARIEKRIVAIMKECEEMLNQIDDPVVWKEAQMLMHKLTKKSQK